MKKRKIKKAKNLNSFITLLVDYLFNTVSNNLELKKNNVNRKLTIFEILEEK